MYSKRPNIGPADYWSLTLANFSVSHIFNTIGQLVDGLCIDHTIAKGLSLRFATSGGLESEAQWAGRQSEGLATAFTPLYSWVYRRKGSVHRVDVGAAYGGGGGGGGGLYPARCIARCGRPKKRPMLRLIGLGMLVCSEGSDTAGNLVRNCEKSVRNQSEITEIWLEIRNQGLENPVEIRKSDITRETPHFCLSMRSRPFAHAHLRNLR